jgi:hypothetical protein
MRHPIYDLGRGREAGIRPRFLSTDVLRWTLKPEDVETWPGHVLEFLAFRFFERTDLWEVIADVNPIKPPWAWQVGDIVLIPRDARRAGAQDQRNLLAELVRKG